MGLLIPSVCFAIAFAALWQSYRDPQVTLTSLSQNTTALLFFAIFVGLGLLLLQFMSFAHHGQYDFYLIAIFCLSWAGLCLLWFLRKMPREKDEDEIVTYELSNAPVDELDDATIGEMRILIPWYLQPFDIVDRLLLKIAGLSMLLVML